MEEQHSSAGSLEVLNEESLLIQVSLGDRPITALIDSGAAVSVFDTSLLPFVVATGAVRSVQSDTGRATLTQADRTSIRIFGRMFVLPAPLVFNLGSIAQTTGREVRVLIGQDVLRQAVFDMETPARRLTICDRLPANDEGWHRVRLIHGPNGRFCLPVDLGSDRTALAFLDLGSSKIRL